MRPSAFPATLVLIVIYYCKPTCSKSDISYFCTSFNTHRIKIRLYWKLDIYYFFDYKRHPLFCCTLSESVCVYSFQCNWNYHYSNVKSLCIYNTIQRKLECYFTYLCSLSSSVSHPKSKSKPTGSCNLFPKSGQSVSLLSPRIFCVPSSALIMQQFLKDHNRIFIVPYNIHPRIPFSGDDF